MADVSSLKEDVFVLLGQAKRAHQRRILRLRGSEGWVRAQCELALRSAHCEDVRILRGNRLYAEDGSAERVRDCLGIELGRLVVDGFTKLDADALGAALGMIGGGGLLIWLDHEQAADTAFSRHVEAALNSAEGVITHREAGTRLARASACEAAEPARFYEWGARTFDQERAVSALFGLLDRAAQPIVLTAHRGRGKSSALGLFVSAALARDEALRIAVTAAHLRGTDTLMARVAAAPRALLSRVRVVSAFDLAHGKADVDIVLVDEAAGLSVELLSAMVAHYPRIAFATTVHGYEGSGQGFRVRFMEQLQRTFPRTRELVLDTPVRWAANDPVEAFAARALVLDAAPAIPTDLTADDAWLEPRPDVTIERVERAQLAANESLLRALFGTFVLAHYRTTPSDLAHLLDDEGVQLWAAREGSEIVGALWAVAEGGLDAQSAVRIAQGQLRPRGHMLPEAFARHLNETEAAQLRGLRVVRIAVAPRARRCGTASALLTALTSSARREGFAYLGAGFAATAEVVSFWQANQCSVVHIGSKRGAASGEVSALVFRGLRTDTEQLVRRLRARFSDELADRLRDGLHELSPDVVACVWERSAPFTQAERSESQHRRLESYMHDAVPYEAVVAVLHRFVVARANAGAFWPLLAPQALLIAKVLQGRSWSDVRRSFRFASVAEAMRAVRRAIMEEYGEQSALRSDM